MNLKLIGALGALALIVIGYLIISDNNSQNYETISASSEPAIQAVYATGTVEAGIMIPISPKTPARLLELLVDEGARVEKGDVLAQLEDTDIRSAVTELEARLALSNSDLSRAQKLSKTGAISKSGLDEARAAQKTAQAAYDRTKAELDYLKLIAPETGTIIRRDGEIGEMIPLNQPVFWMTGGDSLRVETEVDEEDIPLVENGQEVVISADAYPGQIFKGTVQSITPKGDPVARSYRVRISLNEATPLMIGMTAETNIITQQKDNALMIASSAVRDGKLFVLRNGKPELVSITTGIKTQDKIEVLEGITADDIVIKNYADISQGQKEDRRVCNMGTGC
jgi:multidrug efflux system membrane fusion protein